MEPTLSLDGFDAAVAQALEVALDGPPGVAVFDADHTLWHHDVGESFHRTLIRDKRLLGLDYTRDLYADYCLKESSDPLAAYSDLVLLMAGLADTDLASWARHHVEQVLPPTVYPQQRRLIQALRARHWDVWVVSASNRWAVEAGAALLGIAGNRVLAVTPVVDAGLVRRAMAFPMPWREGKVAAIQRFVGKDPDLVAGDSVGDVPMLRLARRISLLVEHPESRSQAPVRALARKHGWICQQLDDPRKGAVG